jgi:Concanavalin A-like lectin/glucanases superfamily/Carboxypeptidase regulatory-like domain/Secretion system C-terminal sorting domain/Transglutaminase-like superfamily
MKRFFVIVVLLVIVFTLFAEDRGLTTRELKPAIEGDGGVAPAYNPPQVDRTGTRPDPINRDTWSPVDSIYFDTYISAYSYLGAKFNSEDGTLDYVSNLLTLHDDSKLAVAKSPAWIRTALENTLRQLTSTNQQKWAGVINDAVDPYIDEIAFSVANSSPAYLSSPYAYTEVFEDNAFYIYEIDNDLSYVEVIDYGNSYTDEDYYSTTKYWKKDAEGNLYQVEVPRDIYYWYIVHPKITDEIPAYIDPTIVENNGSHNNNITGPDDGVFWRDYLYNHNDEDYPKLKYFLQNCDIAWNGLNHDINNAIGATHRWISQSMVFTSNSERPHQPVRIYAKHIGRCGEHADLRAAALRIALIPGTSILSISGDHTWNEFWDEEWIHYDGGDLNNPLVYENGWGKVFSSVFEIRSDGVLTPVTETYSEGWATLEVYVLDSNGAPVDGARILLGTTASNTSDNLGVTDNEGKYIFIVGDSKSYSASITSSVGNTAFQQIVANTEPGETYTHVINLTGTMPAIDYTAITTPGDTTDDYKIFAEFNAENQIIRGIVPFDDIDNGFYAQIQEEGLINFAMTSETEFDEYTSGDNFEAFLEQIDVESGASEFNLPVAENWFALLENGNSLRNPQHVTGWFTLYSYDETGGMGTIAGTVTDPVNSIPIADAVVTAGVYETTTANDGTYFMDVYPNTYDVLFEAGGYFHTTQIDISVSNGGNTTVDAEMQELIYAPTNVDAEILINGNVMISWDEPDYVRNQANHKKKKANSRELTGYNIYVGENGEEGNVAAWAQVGYGVSGNSFEDNVWPALPAGIYKYAVRSVYADDTLSAPDFSNMLYNDMHVSVDVMVFTNSGDSSDGASVNLKNQECPNSAFDYSGIVENGATQFSAIFKGIYTLTVTKPNFEDFVLEDIEILEQANLQGLLYEMIFDVQGVGVINYTASWDAVPADELNRSFQGYNVYVDDMTTPAATVNETSYDLSTVGAGIHDFGVSAVFSTGESAVSNLEYEDGNSMFTDIVGFYELDGDATDSSGNGNDGQINGDITFAYDGVIGLCAEYDEEAEYIVAPDVFTTAPEAFTVSWWLLPNSNFNWNQQVRATVGWDAFNFHSTNENTIYAGVTTGTRFTPNTCSEGVTIGEWNLFTFTYDNGYSSLYKNGNIIASRTNMNAPIAWDGFQMGIDNANTIDGKIDDVRVWERSVGTAEVQYIFTENYPFWGILEGTVTSAVNGDPVEGAVITAGMFQTITDAAGFYSIDVAGCTYPLVSCSFGDYDVEFVEDIVVGDGETLVIDFEYGFTGSDDPILIPTTTKLNNNYPNPFNPSTTIEFQLSTETSEFTELVIYNLKGQKVKQLVKDQLSVGNHSAVWNGKDENDRTVSSGIYFYQLKAGNVIQTKKMMLMK